MYFTREPIIETIISPKEGFKLVARNSKGSGQEDFLVDALEVVSFGNAFFYRSLEKPKSFLVPVSDYEVLEIRDTRLVLKHSSNAGKSIKIGGGKAKESKETKDAKETKDSKEVKETKDTKISKETKETKAAEELLSEEGTKTTDKEEAVEAPLNEKRLEKKRDRRRHTRKRRSREELQPEAKADSVAADKSFESKEESNFKDAPNEPIIEGGDANDELSKTSSSVFPSILPPPTSLISDRIAHLKDEKVSESDLPSQGIGEEPAVETEPTADKSVTKSSEETLEEPSEKKEEKTKKSTKGEKKADQSHLDESCALGFNVPHK
ncbi:MAG: hypothetical protein ACQEP8_04945 [Chlamydiota bacterium]